MAQLSDETKKKLEKVFKEVGGGDKFWKEAYDIAGEDIDDKDELEKAVASFLKEMDKKYKQDDEDEKKSESRAGKVLEKHKEVMGGSDDG